MTFEWIEENPPRWDAEKQKIIGGAPPGAFAPTLRKPGDLLPGDWWRVESGGQVLGYGWMDCTWGDAEILLAVDAEARGRGVGTFILDSLEREAASCGVNYLLNEVRKGHPNGAAVTAWLGARQFSRSHDDRLLRRRVHPS